VLIDWFTVLAQIVNFLVLVLLLKRFLYGPIIRAMEAREQRIAAAMDEAKKGRAEAEQRSQELEKEKRALLGAKEKILTEARGEVDAWREKTLQEARDEIDTLRRVWRDRLTQDREAFLRKLKAQVALHVLQISEKTLKDLASDDLERHVIRVFLEKVETEGLQLDLDGDGKTVSVQSGFELGEELADVLRRGLARHLPHARRIEFEKHPDLGMGIQVVAGDRRVAWDLTGYLEALEREILTDLFAAKQEDV
jgi:F-type H+-transporting ATPase subunit b